jgi:YHS domain-containing protein
MVYASAYTYRATVWFDFVVPGPAEREWLREKYPNSWREYEPVWDRITRRWEESEPRNDFAVHGTSIVGFCNLCQIVLSNGSPRQNTAIHHRHNGQSYVFCSEPCRWIFMQEPERYEGHLDVVKRVLTGEAPGNLVAILRNYFGLSFGDWGKDAFGGEYSFVHRKGPTEPPPTPAADEMRGRMSGQMVPIYGLMEGDTIGLLIFAYDDESIASLTTKLQKAAELRAAPLKNPCLFFSGRAIDPRLTVAEAGLQPLDIFEVRNGV